MKDPKQRDVKEIAAEIVLAGWSSRSDLIVAALQAERDRAEALQKRLDDGKCLIEKAAEVIGEVAELRTRAENAEYVAKTAQQAAITRVEEVNANFDALLDKARKAEHDLAEAVLQRNNLLCRIHRNGGTI